MNWIRILLDGNASITRPSALYPAPANLKLSSTVVPGATPTFARV